MLCKMLIAIAAFSTLFIEISAVETGGDDLSVEQHMVLSKSHHKRGPRGHRGHRGRRGKSGANGSQGANGVAGVNGSVVVSGVYADAIVQQSANSGPTTFAVLNGPITFNKINLVSGVDVSQALSNGKFIIQSAGDYLISYNVYGSFDDLVPPDDTAYIGVLVNGIVSSPTIVGTVTHGSTIQMSGQIILNLNVNDEIQIAPQNLDLLTIASLPTAPLKIASLTIQKL